MKDDNQISFHVLRAQSGDREALNELLKEWQEPLYRFLTRLLHNSADAEDVLQITFLQVCRKIRTLREPLLFRPWVYRIAARTAYRIRQRRGAQVDFVGNHELSRLATDVHDGAETAEFQEQIPELLNGLTVKCRDVVVLHYIEELTVPQVATILNIPLGTAKSRLSYALACLRQKIVQPTGDV